VRLTRSGFALIEHATVDHLANEARLLGGLPHGAAERLANDLRELLVALERDES
jgi:hypothetical protein